MIQDQMNYNRIASAIHFMREHFHEHPSLDRIADHVHLSPFHFQRMFTEWAGVSPKQFQKHLDIKHAKALLRGQQETSLFDVTSQIGLSGTGRLHDLFVTLEKMTPGEFKNGVDIHYSFGHSPFGKVLIASTEKGICHVQFTDKEDITELIDEYPTASLHANKKEIHNQVENFLSNKSADTKRIKLHLKGSEFQIKVWNALLKIPLGKVSTYGHIANQIGNPNASRAVGTAIGSNPIAYIIPCHRVIQQSGAIGGYKWNPDRKTLILGWESAQSERNTHTS